MKGCHSLGWQLFFCLFFSKNFIYQTNSRSELQLSKNAAVRNLKMAILTTLLKYGEKTCNLYLRVIGNCTSVGRGGVLSD